MESLREDRSDTKRALAHHTSGDEYIVEYCSVWEQYIPTDETTGDAGERCVGTRIIAAVGPLAPGDLPVIGAGIRGLAAVYDAIDNAVNLSGEDADWLQAEEDAGRLSYPIGAR